jgi:hypothetical protein
MDVTRMAWSAAQRKTPPMVLAASSHLLGHAKKRGCCFGHGRASVGKEDCMLPF